ncbi:NACHT, LRR and PYD domains-containing protein 3-like isoform X1 [Erpetoichthys calabaricus]|uniref:NACHT, LRR and PYD domains-containing protein 3-like isoform X1 n=1 Tax=Erpetoichthys calabaricus TaxID=27687 RepID=UPI0022343C61|nr:NACHT, LRR and PYD domains-containing protein 3-like isoform X1 [Erpetoichthys calabaricus]XP_028678670.2 NACHT, LRR and PYD domains-containing protein 3-like isoform X1 [Erpetoichthys calabaricus]XP_028678672.2 NACHT, LRR and PYD domains-containing protein 3-like isoform X1 [Erpetoichthys calabaricus]
MDQKMQSFSLIRSNQENLLVWLSDNPSPLLRWLYDRNVFSQSLFHSLLEKTPSNSIVALLDHICHDGKRSDVFLQVLWDVQEYYCPELGAWLQDQCGLPGVKASDVANAVLPETKPGKLKRMPFFKFRHKKYTLSETAKGQSSIKGASLKYPRWRVPLSIHKKSLVRRTGNIVDHIEDSKSRTHIEIRYTDLFVTDDDPSLEIEQHEYFSLANRRARIYNHHKCQRISPSELLSPLPGQDWMPKRVKVKGIAGIGKSIAVQRLIHDWALGVSMRNFTCVFDFTFRELSLTEAPVSLAQLIMWKFDHLTEILPDLFQEPAYLLFLLDGLDEFKYKLNFNIPEKPVDVHTELPVGDLVSYLFKGSLLPESSVIITTRPSTDIPRKYCHRCSIILGFEQKQVEDYCFKYYKDPDLSKAVYRYIANNDTLFGLSFIPLYCYIICTALSEFFTRCPKDTNIDLSVPKTVSEVYLCYLYTVIRHHVLRDEECVSSSKNVVFSAVKRDLLQLSKFAYQSLMSNKILFEKADFESFGMPLQDLPTSFFSQILIQVKEEQVQMFAFFHMTIQEHLAALYSATEVGEDDLVEALDLWCGGAYQEDPCSSEFLQTSKELLDVSKLESLQMFTRFFSGLLAARLGGQLGGLAAPLSNEVLAELSMWFGRQFQKKLSNQQVLNLLHCLMELHQESVVKMVAPHIKKLHLFKMTLNVVDCTALCYVIRHARHDLEELNLGYSNIGHEGLKRLQPILHKCELLFLRYNCLDKEAAALESLILKSPSCHVRKLYMCGNNIGCEGVLELWTALKDNSTVEELYLDITGITERGTENIVACLSNNKTLKSLTIVGNDLGDLGKKRLRQLRKERPDLRIIENFIDDLGLLQAYLDWVEELKADKDQMDSVKNVDALHSVLKGLNPSTQGPPKANAMAKLLEQKITELLQSPGYSSKTL